MGGSERKGCIVNLRSHRRGMLKIQMQQHAEHPQFCVGQHLSPPPNKKHVNMNGYNQVSQKQAYSACSSSGALQQLDAC